LGKQNSKQNFDFDIEVGAHDDVEFCYNSRNLTEFWLNQGGKSWTPVNFGLY
jgi:hypothetical protein